MTCPVLRFTILGQAASKANSRQLVTIGGRARVIKSARALAFRDTALAQIPPACRVRMQGKVAVTLRMYYTTERPDLSEELVLDCLQTQWRRLKVGKTVLRQMTQAGVFENDRQVREKHVYHGIDARNPRVEVEVRSMAPVLDMFMGETAQPAKAPIKKNFGVPK